MIPASVHLLSKELVFVVASRLVILFEGSLLAVMLAHISELFVRLVLSISVF